MGFGVIVLELLIPDPSVDSRDAKSTILQTFSHASKFMTYSFCEWSRYPLASQPGTRLRKEQPRRPRQFPRESSREPCALFSTTLAIQRRPLL
ncbi:hypothetical protein THTE_2819 [Thermogutta terrifontis]|uniref:Uncharacterized protein n=1 Tax=Thermogutta terrifontis TaxID=1331910 RepID=A0A286RHH2_9BACT|nr:hypothetical protein THTE_2819 [Thermogutta terrifontis]